MVIARALSIFNIIVSWLLWRIKTQASSFLWVENDFSLLIYYLFIFRSTKVVSVTLDEAKNRGMNKAGILCCVDVWFICKEFKLVFKLFSVLPNWFLKDFFYVSFVFKFDTQNVMVCQICFFFFFFLLDCFLRKMKISILNEWQCQWCFRTDTFESIPSASNANSLPHGLRLQTQTATISHRGAVALKSWMTPHIIYGKLKSSFRN